MNEPVPDHGPPGRPAALGARDPGRARSWRGEGVTDAAIGKRLGGAPLGARLGHFFRGIGLTVIEGYGLTETCAGVTLNLPARQRIGSVGRPVPGCSIRIAHDGEVLIKGGNVFQGYWRNDEATRE